MRDLPVQVRKALLVAWGADAKRRGGLFIIGRGVQRLVEDSEGWRAKSLGTHGADDRNRQREGVER